MIISHTKQGLFNQYYYPSQYTRNKVHFLSALCWFLMIFMGTTLLGINAVQSEQTVSFCADTDSYCTSAIQINETTTIFIYIKLKDYYQHNRMFMDSYSLKQTHGEVDNIQHCGDYYTYSSISKTQSSGGYRVKTDAHIHPCGEVMQHFQQDAVYLVNNQGGTPVLDNGDLTTTYSTSHFIQLNQYQLSQWVDVTSTQFINYFTVPFTSTKYILVGRTQVTAGEYQIVMKNNYLTQGQFSKEVVVAQVGIVGSKNYVIGFAMFAYGIFLLFLHIMLCLRWKK